MFLTLGVKSVTMDEIARELGISKKTIYAHYSTKSKLVEDTALHICDKISCGIKSIRSEDLEPLEELFAIKNFALEHLKNQKSSPQYQLQKYYPKIYDTVKCKQQNVLEEQIKHNLRKGISSGVYREDLPEMFISRIYFVGMTAIKDNEVFADTGYTLKELIEKHFEYHLRAVVTPKGLQSLDNLLNKSTEK